MKSIVERRWTKKKKRENGKIVSVGMVSATCSGCGELFDVQSGNWNRTKEDYKCRPCHIKYKAINKFTDERLYTIWSLIKRRVDNTELTKQGKDYHYDGVNICEEWSDSYFAFKEWAMANGYKKELTIDRKDNDGHYEPLNCRWVTQSVQMQNQGVSCKNTSGIRGVFWDKARGKWVMTLQHEGKTYRKRFKTKEEALDARNEKIKELGTEHGLQQHGIRS